MATFPESLISNFQALSLGQRLGVVVVLALAIATIPMLMMLGKQPELVVLFSQLDSEDTRAIILRQGYGGPPKLYAKVEACVLRCNSAGKAAWLVGSIQTPAMSSTSSRPIGRRASIPAG
jgi:hypothetical protein